MITVVTPTYNRAYIVSNLYKSLRDQTDKRFEWLIVDDGSTDNTEELVRSFQEEKVLAITYVRQANGGKHRALNKAIPLVAGDYIFIVDSDDCLTPDAIQTVYKWLVTIKGRDNIAGVAGLRSTPDGKRIGEFPAVRDFIDVKNSQRYTHGLDGDKAEIYRKDLLLQYPFPEYEGEKYIGEGAVWNAISQAGYKVRWFNHVIYIGEYLSDGLTARVRQLNNKNFNGYTHNTKLNYRVLPFPYNLMAVAVYISAAREQKLDGQEIRIRVSMGIFPYLLCLVIRRIRRIL